MSKELNISDLMSKLPISDLADQLGADSTDITSALKQVVPGLLGGMAANSAADGGSALEKALKQHHTDEVSYSLSAVDEADGNKIVTKVFGEERDVAVSALSGAAGGSAANLVPRLLPLVAPLVMAYLAKATFGAGKPQATPQTSSGGVGDLLGSLLGGGAAQKGGVDLGSLLGKGGGLGGVLGSILGKG